MQCNEIQNLIAGFRVEELRSEEQGAVRAHLASCGKCADAALRDAQFSAWIGDALPEASVSPADRQLLAAVNAQRGNAAHPGRTAGAWQWLAAAAVLLLAIGYGYWAHYGGADTTVASTESGHEVADLAGTTLRHVYSSEGRPGSLAVVQEHGSGRLDLWRVGDRINRQTVSSMEASALTLRADDGTTTSFALQSGSIQSSFADDIPDLYRSLVAGSEADSNRLRELLASLDPGAVALLHRLQREAPERDWSRFAFAEGAEPDVVDRLVAMAADRDNAARGGVIGGLAAYRDPQILLTLQLIALDAKDPEREIAARSLARIGHPATTATLRVLAEDTTLSERVRNQLQKALAPAGEE